MSGKNSIQRTEDLGMADINPRLITSFYRQFGRAKPVIQAALTAQVDKALDELERSRGTDDFDFRAGEAVRTANTSKFFRRFGEFAIQRAQRAAARGEVMVYTAPCKALMVYRQ